MAGYDAPGTNGISPSCPSGIYYLPGGTGDVITFGGGNTPATFSFCVVSRYVAGGTQGRIVTAGFDGTAGSNVLLGHWEGNVRGTPSSLSSLRLIRLRAGTHWKPSTSLPRLRGPSPSSPTSPQTHSRRLVWLSWGA